MTDRLPYYAEPDSGFAERLEVLLLDRLTAADDNVLEPDVADLAAVRVDRSRRHRPAARWAWVAVGAAAVAAVMGLLVVGRNAERPRVPTDTLPSVESQGRFDGSWVSTDTDGSAQTLDIGHAGTEYTIVVHDAAASVCSGFAATMSGTGRLAGHDTLVIPEPILTCDDASAPAVGAGSELAEQLSDLTFVHHPERDDLTDSFGVVWTRGRASAEAGSPEGWPQSEPSEVRAAQARADAGDVDATWQLAAGLAAGGEPRDVELFARYVDERLGWEGYRWWPWEYTVADGTYAAEFVRCAAGAANPLYPADATGGECAPTLDHVRYETVRIEAAQPGRRGATGIWVVTAATEVAPKTQAVPPTDDEITALLADWLTARVAGSGADRFVSDPGVPLLYRTPADEPFTRFEIGPLGGARWPTGEREVTVTLHADASGTSVEQHLVASRHADGVDVDYPGDWTSRPGTLVDDAALAASLTLLGGEVTLDAALPWAYSAVGWDFTQTKATLIHDGNYDEGIVVFDDPVPMGPDCAPGPVPADAATLVESLRSNPNFVVGEPRQVDVAGAAAALVVDVTVASDAAPCGDEGELLFTEPNLRGERRHVYLIDVADRAGSIRVVAVAVFAPTARFDAVAESAAPVIDSLAVHADGVPLPIRALADAAAGNDATRFTDLFVANGSFDARGTFATADSLEVNVDRQHLVAAWLAWADTWGFGAEVTMCEAPSGAGSTADVERYECDVLVHWGKLSMSVAERWYVTLRAGEVQSWRYELVGVARPPEHSFALGFSGLVAWEEWLRSTDPGAATRLLAAHDDPACECSDDTPLERRLERVAAAQPAWQIDDQPFRPSLLIPYDPLDADEIQASIEAYLAAAEGRTS